MITINKNNELLKVLKLQQNIANEIFFNFDKRRIDIFIKQGKFIAKFAKKNFPEIKIINYKFYESNSLKKILINIWLFALFISGLFLYGYHKRWLYSAGRAQSNRTELLVETISLAIIIITLLYFFIKVNYFNSFVKKDKFKIQKIKSDQKTPYSLYVGFLNEIELAIKSPIKKSK